MNFWHLPIPFFFVLQLFASVVSSQGVVSSTASDSTSASRSSVTSGNGSSTPGPTTTSTASGTTNSASSASPTSSAQFPSLSNVSACVSDCLAVTSSNLLCSSEVDVNCFCNNNNYPGQLLSCVLAYCSDQVSTIETLGQEFCNQASGHPTLSFFSVPITTTTSSSISSSSSSSSSTSNLTSTSTASSSSTTTTNGATKFMNGSTNLMGLGAIMVLAVILGGV